MALPILDVSESSGFELHEADEWYDGHINSIEAGEGTFGPDLKFIIILKGEIDREVWAFSSQKLSPKSKLYGWAKALGYPMDTPLNLQNLVGDKVQIMFERYMATDQEGNPLEKEKVVKIREPKGGGGKAEIISATANPSADMDAPF
tara:strand:+ start:2668 stop:3108 length:441 start_codon:yes stop_codon:yes gene_type:complete